MKVLLINIDSKIPNLALCKLEMWHRQQGDQLFDMAVMPNSIDIAYASCIFTKNKQRVQNESKLYTNFIAGGTGFDPKKKLLPEVEAMKPKINLGFTTRGCFRRCPFCLVWVAEGNLIAVGDIYDIWDRKSKYITLLDNNILGLPQHFEKICRQLIKENLAVDFNQGLDIRLVTPQVCEMLEKLKLKNEIRFAFDFPELEDTIRDKVALLRRYRIRKHPFFYVLVGFNTTFEEDLHRLEVLKELGCRAYVMRYENTPKEKRYIRMAQWANQFWTFVKYDFSSFCTAYEEYKSRGRK